MKLRNTTWGPPTMPNGNWIRRRVWSRWIASLPLSGFFLYLSFFGSAGRTGGPSLMICALYIFPPRDVHFGRVCWYRTPFRESYPPKTPIYGCELAFSSQTCKISKLPFFEATTSVPTILNNDKDRQVFFCILRQTNLRWRSAAILKTLVMTSPQPFGRFWRNLAWPIFAPYSWLTITILP